MARHGENIRKRKDGRWEGRYIKGKTPEGKTLWGYLYGQSYEEVKKRLILKKAEMVNYPLDKQNLSFQLLAERWFYSRTRDLKPSTIANYRYTLDRYLLPVLGHYMVQELDEGVMEQSLLEIICPTNGSHQPLGNAMAKECLNLTRQICKYGAWLRYMRPIQIVVRLPRKKNREDEPLSRQEQKRVEEFVLKNPTPRKVGLLLCMQLGLRIGEVCGLQWRDVDWERNTLTVRRTVKRISCGNGKTKVVIQSPKTESSRREIPIPQHLLKALRQFRQDDDVWFLSGRADKPVEPRCYGKSIHIYLEHSQVHQVRPHMLRHTFATFCVQKGCDIKTLSELMGHSDASVTMQKYIHTDFERKRSEIDRMFQDESDDE